MNAAIIHRKRFRIICRNPDGSIAWHEEFWNLTPNEALNKNLSIFWLAVVPPATWYMLLIDNASFSALAATDTAAQINGTNGWKEFTGYSAANRPAVVFGAVAAQSVDNSGSLTTFTINASGTLKGAALVTSNTKSGTSGFLGGEGAFAATQAVSSGQTVTVEVTATAASA